MGFYQPADDSGTGLALNESCQVGELLSHISFIVNLGEVLSSSTEVPSDVPQGSKFDFLVFIIFKNQLP